MSKNTPTSISLSAGGIYATQIALGGYYICAFDNSDAGDVITTASLVVGSNLNSSTPKAMTVSCIGNCDEKLN